MYSLELNNGSRHRFPVFDMNAKKGAPIDQNMDEQLFGANCGRPSARLCGERSSGGLTRDAEHEVRGSPHCDFGDPGGEARCWILRGDVFCVSCRRGVLDGASRRAAVARTDISHVVDGVRDDRRELHRAHRRLRQYWQCGHVHCHEFLEVKRSWGSGSIDWRFVERDDE